MNGNYLQYAKNKVKERRQNAELLAQQNLEKALEIDEFKKLYTQEKEEMISLSKKQALNEKVDLKLLKSILQEENKILKTINLSPSDLKPHYSCTECNDTGVKEDNSYCSCLYEIISQKLRENCGNAHNVRNFEDCDFNIFDEENRENIKSFYNKMQVWCQNKENRIQNIVICGNTGVGKTFLLECMLSELLKENKSAIFTTAFNLNQSLLKYHTTFDNTKANYLDPYLLCDTLLIDDLGTEPILKNVTIEYLLAIINQRVIEGKNTVISTNLDLGNLLDRYGERIFSRLIDKRHSITVNLQNSDIRLQK